MLQRRNTEVQRALDSTRKDEKAYLFSADRFLNERHPVDEPAGENSIPKPSRTPVELSDEEIEEFFDEID
jgi:hypothetical protein